MRVHVQLLYVHVCTCSLAHIRTYLRVCCDDMRRLLLVEVLDDVTIVATQRNEGNQTKKNNTKAYVSVRCLCLHECARQWPGQTDRRQGYAMM